MHWSELSQRLYYLLLALVLLSFGLLVLRVNIFLYFHKRIKIFDHVDVVLQWTDTNSFDLYILATLIGGHASLRQAPETPDPFAQEV